MKAKVGSSFRNSFSHKSVFTYKQLKELMAAYGFKIIKTQGYHYGLMQGDEGGGNYGRIRSIVNSFSPTKLKEGIFLIVKKGGIEWF